MSKAKGFFFLMLVWGLSIMGEAQARVIYVPKDYTTIEDAIKASEKGDKIKVAQGTYYENIAMKEGVILEGGWSKDFSRRDVATYVTTIDGGKGGGWVVYGANGATLDGFAIVNARAIGEEGTERRRIGSGVHLRFSSPIIKNNTIKTNEPSGIYCYGSSATIMNNIISENKEAGIRIENGSRLLIDGNIIKNNGEAGISSGGPENSYFKVFRNTINNNGRGGIDADALSGIISNNVIYENAQAGIRCVIIPMEIINNTVVANGMSGIVVEDRTVAPTIKNNIVTHNKDSGIRAAGKGYSHNLLFANNILPGSGEKWSTQHLYYVRRQYAGFEDERSYQEHMDIIADPLYMDAANHDYHLRSNSPAIDAGDPDVKFNDIHFPPSLGASRNDMGAYGGPHALPERLKSNNVPVADVGPLQEVYIGDKVTLDGSGSHDPDGDFISYEWTFSSVPRASQARLSNPSVVNPSFTVDVPGNYVVRLIVKDRWGKVSKPHTATITALPNRPPKAYGGENMDIYVGDTVTLYGGGSSDPDGDQLTYRWEFSFKPSKSRAEFSDPNSMSPNFLVDVPGCYVVKLVVNDGKVDSASHTINIKTRHTAIGGKRNVPQEYPTIQAALDAADPGDTIIVHEGTYRENLVIDTNVDLIGVGWPVVDGGSKEGNVDTIMVAFVGLNAGRIEGLVVTGGGSGPQGHAIDVWDSSPTIVNNKVMDNPNNGIGLHGSSKLTGNTKVYNNQVYNNKAGIGNGKGSAAHIYNNHVYDNWAVGVGCIGRSAPRIEGNHIYGNHIGIGCREVASPHIEGNYIFENDCGVTISPTSTIRVATAGDAIVIKNNLIFGNHQVGVSVTSFNLSEIIVVNNTVDSNNTYGIRDRAGGIVFGWPWPGAFTATVENNIVTNNKKGGIANHTGSELFPSRGVNIISRHNNVWNNEDQYVGCSPGEGDLSLDPLFVSVTSEKYGSYYLSQKASGQVVDSPCVGAGSRSAIELGLQNKSTRTDKTDDTGIVDMGFHYPK